MPETAAEMVMLMYEYAPCYTTFQLWIGMDWLWPASCSKLQTAHESQETFQLPCTHIKIQESMHLMATSSVSMSVPAEVRDSLSKLVHHHTIVSACPAPNILFSSAAFCAAFAAFLAFLISSFLITATVALALGVPTACIQE